jgi:hypothetical protein
LVRSGSNTAVLEKNFQISGGTAATADETAAAMSRAVGKLANAIVSTLSQTEMNSLPAATPENSPSPSPTPQLPAPG